MSLLCRTAALGLSALVALTTVAPTYAASPGTQHPIQLTVKPTGKPLIPRKAVPGSRAALAPLRWAILLL